MSFYLHRVVGSRTVLQTVESRVLRIGRGAGCELRLDDTAVALEHAVIRREKGSYHLTDLGSVTGTYVNGEPVATARLHDGDEVGIGGFLLKVSRSDPEDPLFLHIRSADAEPRPDAAPLAAPTADYARGYRLRQGLLSKGFLALAATLVTVAAVAALPAARRLGVFQPGDLTSFHRDRPGRPAAAACGDCHEPWRGVTDARCQECHGEGRMDAAPVHHAEVLAARGGPVPCTSCHLEHMGREGLMPAGDRACVECHRDLSLGAGVAPVFADSVAAFDRHPEIRLTLPAAPAGGLRGSGLVRVPVTEPAARVADRATLELNHAKHLAPGLLDPTAPTGRVQLTCTDCHRAEGGEMVTISFEEHCARCHALTFDDRFPGRTVAHGPPEEVAAELFLAYLEGDRQSGSVREDVREFLVPGRRPQTARERAAREEVRRAEARLYESRCALCHAMDLSATPRPTVADPAVPESWLPHARFRHGEHLQLEGLECVHCHEGAERSTATADVLLPGIGACTPCHRSDARRGEVAAAGFPVTPGPWSCLTCHEYHSGNRFPAVAASGAPRSERAAEPISGGAS